VTGPDIGGNALNEITTRSGHAHQAEILKTLHRLSMDELLDAKRLIQDELDQRQGRKKFQPVQAWDNIHTRQGRA
jgi:hypothetical protein